MTEVPVRYELNISVAKVFTGCKQHLDQISHIFLSETRSKVVSCSRISKIGKSVPVPNGIPCFLGAVTLIRATQVLIEDSGLVLLSCPHSYVRSFQGIQTRYGLVAGYIARGVSGTSTVPINNIVYLLIAIKPESLLPDALFEKQRITMNVSHKILAPQTVQVTRNLSEKLFLTLLAYPVWLLFHQVS